MKGYLERLFSKNSMCGRAIVCSKNKPRKRKRSIECCEETDVFLLVHPLTLNKVSSNLPELNKLDLPTPDSDYADKTAVITGYGLYNVDWTSMKFDEHDQVIHIGDDTSSNKLHRAEARVISNEACKSLYNPSIKSRHLCANVLHCPRGQCSKPGICQQSIQHCNRTQCIKHNLRRVDEKWDAGKKVFECLQTVHAARRGAFSHRSLKYT
ncbi:unnamed protein product [Trichogramma brassicae]|uniref:Peptidase S1 domain-containing protein n=1 Tax=Trichogramma brassicae TaxID=86971 RepID=A0A6H5HWA3_9HYME|nr:unnamed protein product [Trichogramma brassicae]